MGTATAVTVVPSAISGIVLATGQSSVGQNFGEVADTPDLVVSKSAVPIGKLEGIILDPEERHVRYYVVESKDWFRTHRYLVPDAPHQINWDRKSMQVELDETALAKLPELRDDEYPPCSDEDLR